MAKKMATEKQIAYANGISKALELDVTFNSNSSFYEVSKFIRINEKDYKSNKRKATERQIDFANAISDICEFGIEFDENSLFEEVNKFITEHKIDYRKAIYRMSIESGEPHTGTTGREYTTEGMSPEALLFLYENLYKKSGVYAFVGKDNEIIYIGKSVDLSSRIPSSFRERRGYADIKRIMYFQDDNITNVNILEILLISENDPLLNGDCKTDCKPTMFHSNLDIIKDFSEIPCPLSNTEKNIAV